ncbi:Uncharacterised protein [Orientia tsutsugamushi]|uniref:Uncharacterized protein n=1 Tax=Orientia tsutsugamushi TaxID=784 RepID=A0A2R8F306_ORITS|nr:Uncharacterised protein [Orientia tsutsugamushi]
MVVVLQTDAIAVFFVCQDQAVVLAELVDYYIGLSYLSYYYAELLP